APERERAAVVLAAAIDRADALHRLAGRVVDGQQENRRVEHLARLFVQHAEETDEVPDLGESRREVADELEPRSDALLWRRKNRCHAPASTPCCFAHALHTWGQRRVGIEAI